MRPRSTKIPTYAWEKLSQAAAVIDREPAAMTLRYLQTLTEIASGQSSTILFPVPLELVRLLRDPPNATDAPGRHQPPTTHQYEVSQAMGLAFAQYDVRMIITTGDNIYAGRRILGIPTGATGAEDDDWFFTFFQPYRYILNRIPVYPCIGNHDTEETEDRDDREQLMDNLYLRERIASDEASGRASLDPGLFYRFRYGRDVDFICIDTSKEDVFRGKRLYEYPKHWEWINQTFAPDPAARWRFAFCHHPPFDAGPNHHNTDRMEPLLPLFSRAGVRIVFSGHEHNFQHSRHEGIDYFVTGAGSKLDPGTPHRFDEAKTVSWSNHAHFLLVTIQGGTITVRAIGELTGGTLDDVPRFTPAGDAVSGPIVLQL